MADRLERSYTWKSRADFVRTVTRIKHDTEIEVITFEHVPQNEISKLLEGDDELDHRDPRYLITSYEADIGRFAIRLPSSWALGQARQAFSYVLRTLVRADVIPNVVAFHGSATVRSSDGRIQADPDNSIVPMSRVRPEAGIMRDVPSIVVDVARAQGS